MNNAFASVVGTVATIGLFFLLVFAAIISLAVFRLLKHFIRRACALEELGVIAAIRHGFSMVRQNLKDVGLMWLILLGLQIGWPIVIAPVVFLLLGVGALVGGLIALLVGSLTGLFLEGGGPWIIAISTGIPVFILILAVPLAFLNGLRETFISSTWTLTYREVRALEGLEEDEGRQADDEGIEQDDDGRMMDDEEHYMEGDEPDEAE